MPDQDAASVAELDAFLRDNPDIEAIDAVFPDLTGVLRGKRLTLDHARQLYTDGLQLPGSMLLLSVTGSCLDPLGLGVSDGDPDVSVRPLAGSLLRLPWAARPRGQVTLTFLDDNGAPNPCEPRQVLAGVLARFAELGLQPVVACELEFCLVDRERDADGMPQPPASPVAGRRHGSTQLMSLSHVDDFGAWIDDITAACRQLDVPVTALNAEYGGDQFEINLHHVGDAVLAADQAVLLRQIVQGTAVRHDLRATFMAKPYADTAGSGMHWHVSMLDADGRNVFDDDSEAGSGMLRQAAAGVLQTMPEAMPFWAPNINSYRRFQPGLFVPMSRSWGYNNRSVALRVPGGDAPNRRLEFRVPGADANPCLALAALLAGMHHGIDARLQPPAPVTGNACETADSGLPLRLPAALQTLRSAKTLPAYLGERYCAIYADCKQREYDAFLDELSAKEQQWYLRPEA